MVVVQIEHRPGFHLKSGAGHFGRGHAACIGESAPTTPVNPMARPSLYLSDLIDLDAWNRAGWTAVLFLTPAEDGAAPGLAFLYTNGTAGAEIFQGLRAKLGSTDEREALRISIVEGDLPGEDPGYTVLVGPNFEVLAEQAVAAGAGPRGYAGALSRMLRLNPDPASQGLALFKEAVRRHGGYFILPATFGRPGDMSSVTTAPGLAITKREIHFRDVSDLKPGDPDAVILAPEA